MRSSLLWMVLLFVWNGLVQAMPFPWIVDPNAPTNEIQTLIPNAQIPGNLLILTSTGDIYRSINWGDSWQHINASSDNRMIGIVKSPYAKEDWYGFSGGESPALLKSVDDGLSWSVVGEAPVQISYLSPSPLIPGRLLLASQPASDNQISLFRSTDDGSTWDSVHRASISPVRPIWHPTAYWKAFWSTLESTDEGLSWFNASTLPIEANGYELPSSFYAFAPTALMQSKDDIQTWWPILQGNFNFIDLHPRSTSNILTGFQNSNYHSPGSASAFVSYDNGKTFSTWSDRLPPDSQEIIFAADWLFFAISSGNLFKYDERPADIDSNLRIDGGDLVIISIAFGAMRGDSKYNYRADINVDGAIDGQDLIILSSVWGHTFFYEEKHPVGDFGVPGALPFQRSSK